MFARFSNGTRPFFAIVGVFVAVAPSLGSGCGGSPTATASPDASVEASIAMGVTIGHVVTTGGGALDAASSGGSITNPFGGSSSSGSSDDSGMADDGGSVSDGSGTSDGSSSSGSNSSSSGSADGSSDASSSSDGPVDGGICATYTPPVCGGGPCDLSSHTCCITVTLAERCIAGTNARCNSNEAAVHCADACDCPTGKSCCGTIDTLAGSVQSTCQSLDPSVSGGNCPPYPATVSQASAQLCAADSECRNGQGCISQTCVYGAHFYLCGLYSESPYNCKAN